ncbi:MAG: surface-adhesin E family protein [Nitrosomonadaceae bacterium]
MPKAILILLLAAVSNGAAAEWVNVSTDDSGSTIYADPSTIRKVGNRVKMWVLFDYRKATLDAGDKIMSKRKHEEYDCKKRQIRLLYLSKHSGRFTEGKVVYLNDIPYNKWVPVVPGSVFEDLWRYACR